MISTKLAILSNIEVAPGIFALRLVRPAGVELKAGQFINIAVPGKTLRRPISLHDYDENTLTVVYRVVGEGTKDLSRMSEGHLDVLLPLGNGFDYSAFSNEVLIVGGGMGTAPLYAAAKEALKRGLSVKMIYGFRSPREEVFREKLRHLPVQAMTCYDTEGENVVDVMIKRHWENIPFLACGPLPMSKALAAASQADGQFSLEARMGCGFGACMGCSFRTTEGMKRICKEGPVFRKEEILWQNLK